jgi:hypothetical protein
MNRLILLPYALLACGHASAQLHLPGPNLPLSLPPGLSQGLGQAGTLIRPVERLVDRRALPDLRSARLEQTTRLLRLYPDRIEADPRRTGAARRDPGLEPLPGRPAGSAGGRHDGAARRPPR